jgi:hypothetical protein
MHSLEDLNTGKLHGIRRLDLSCGLTEFPRAIFELADSLEVLNLSGNALSSLPDDLYRLRHMRILFVSDNDFIAAALVDPYRQPDRQPARGPWQLCSPAKADVGR